MTIKKPTVAVLAGGVSEERSVSLRSGKAVADALIQAGYACDTFDITNERIQIDPLQKYDVIFPVIHGKGGEDGALQEQLDAAQIRYVGSGADASKLCFDKAYYRAFIDENNLPLAAGETVNQKSFWNSNLIHRPFVLKPIDGGSSLDTMIVRDVSKIDTNKVSRLLGKRNHMLLEQLLIGTEITIGVLGEAALPVIEIIPPQNGEFDYINKYNGATQELCPPKNVTLATQERAKQLALKIHAITGCRHYSRTDMFVLPDDRVIILETNTLPGMTMQSLLPKAAATNNIPMPMLVDQLIQMAIN